MHIINQQHGLSHLQKPHPFTPATTQLLKQLLTHPTLGPRLLALPKCAGLQGNRLNSMNNISLPHVFGREIVTLVGNLTARKHPPTAEELDPINQLLATASSYLDVTDEELLRNLKGTISH